MDPSTAELLVDWTELQKVCSKVGRTVVIKAEGLVF